MAGADIDPALSIADLTTAYRRRELSPVDVVAAHLARIDVFEPDLNAFMWVDADSARTAAEASEARWAAGEPLGPLDGVPTTIKDIVLMAGYPTRYGTATSPATPDTESAPAVERLLEAGAIVLGKTTTPEFGWKGMTDGPLFGTTRNPWNLDHTPGGSSGGAGATMAAGIGTVAFGNDGGGSIRIPSSYSGLYGIKPTTGRVPHHPPSGPGDSLGAGGPLARSTADAAAFLDVLARPDRRDWYSLPDDPRDWRVGIDDGIRGLRVAVTHTLGGAEARPEIVAAFEHAVEAFAELGAHVETVGTVFEPLRPRFEAHWKALFGLRLRTVPAERWDELDPGFFSLAREGLDVDLATFAAAQGEQARHGAELRRFHETYDLLITPTMPRLPPRADVIYHSPDHDRWHDAVPYTVPFNLTGQPAASVPCAVVDGLPVGLQIVADRYREDLVLRAMRAFETARPFPWPHPALAASLDAMGR